MAGRTAPERRVFILPSNKPLKTEALVRRVKDALENSYWSFIAPLFSAKSFRKGGASSLVEACVEQDDICLAGAWKPDGIVPFAHYVGEEQLRQRQIGMSR